MVLTMMNTSPVPSSSFHQREPRAHRIEPSVNDRFSRMRQLVLQQRREHARQIQQLREQSRQPVAELAENSQCIRLSVDLPGVLASDLEVLVEEGVLSIKASRKIMSIDGTSCLKKQKISRRYAINTDVVDIQELEAHLAHGVLTVNAPKKGKTHRISVDAESDQESTLSPTDIQIATGPNSAVKVSPTIERSESL